MSPARVVVDGGELRALSAGARRSGDRLDGALRQAGALIGGLDRRGWNTARVEQCWTQVRVSGSRLSARTGDLASDLSRRAAVADILDQGGGFSVLDVLLAAPVPGIGWQEWAVGVLLPTSAMWGPRLSAQASAIYQLLSPARLIHDDGESIQKLTEARSIFFRDPGRPDPAYRDQSTHALFRNVWDPSGAWTALPGWATSAGQQVLQTARNTFGAGGTPRREGWIDKLDPTIQYTHDIASPVDAALWQDSEKLNNNVYSSVELGSVHDNAQVGLQYDLAHQRAGASLSQHAEMDAIRVDGHAGQHLGNDVLGGGVTGDVSGTVGGEEELGAKIGLDLRSGRLDSEIGGDAFVGAQVSGQTAAAMSVAGAKTEVVGQVTGYAGFGAMLKGSGDIDLAHGRIKFGAKVGAAVGLGASGDISADIDLSAVPQTLGATRATAEGAEKKVGEAFSALENQVGSWL